jgi:2-keto-3-deoxy-L-rhamnonate aldolase RhmA
MAERDVPTPSKALPFGARLRAGEPQAGTVLSSPDPVFAERAAQAFDFVWIDLEHSALGMRDVVTLTIAVQAGGASALVRLPRFDSELLTAALDTGADGVVAPKITSAADADVFARSLRYPPHGSRGFAPRRANSGRANAADIGANVACLVQIELSSALEDIEAIAATPGVDGIVIGLADLSLDLGCPLDMEAEALVAAARRVGDAAARNDTPWGLAAGTLNEWIRRSWTADARMLVFSSDLRLYAEAVDAAARRLLEPRMDTDSRDNHPRGT